MPVGAKFSASVETGSEAHPVSYKMGTGSFLRVKRPVLDHSPPSSADDIGRVVLYLYSTSGPSQPVLGWTFIFTFYLQLSLLSQVTGLHTVYLLFCFWIRQLYSTESLHLPRRPVAAAVLRDTIKGTLCSILHGTPCLMSFLITCRYETVKCLKSYLRHFFPLFC